MGHSMHLFGEKRLLYAFGRPNVYDRMIVNVSKVCGYLTTHCRA
jgi:hypothetical protein